LVVGSVYAARTASTPAATRPAALRESLRAPLTETWAGPVDSGVLSLVTTGLIPMGAKVVTTGLTETTEETDGLTLAQEMLATEEVGAAFEDEVDTAAAAEEATAAAPQLAGSMPSGQQTPSDKQKDPLGHDQVAEQHFWPASGL